MPSIHQGDALAWLANLPVATVDAVVTDPPYSSGGMTRSDRSMDTRSKYTDAKRQLPSSLEFSGDNRDQRGWVMWSSLWLAEALRVTRPGGAIVMFCDWRQLPAATDALQAGGWVWRGIVPWHKPNGRRQLGRFAGNCEYALWGSAGPRPQNATEGTLDGFFRVNAPHDKQHITQKPLEIMRELVRICPAGGTVCDPFAGSGQTGIAAALEGREFIGCEITDHYAAVAEQRINTTLQEYRDDGSQMVLGA